MNQYDNLQTEQTQRVANLSELAQKIECRTCKFDPKKAGRNIFITTLNISKGVKLGERLLCQQCNQIQFATLNLDQAEDYLTKWKKNEEEQINIQKQQFDTISKFIKKTILIIKKNLDAQFQRIEQQVDELDASLRSEHAKESKLDKKILKLRNSFGEDSLRELASYFSEQSFQGNDLIRSDVEPHKIPTEINKAIQILSGLCIGQCVDEKLKEELKQFMKEFELNNNQFNQQLVYKQEELKPKINFQERVTAVAIKQGNEYIVNGFSNGVIILWKKNKQIWDNQLEEGLKIQDLAFSKMEQLFAAAYQKDIYLYNFRNLSSKSANIIKAHEKNIWKIKFSHNSNYLISCSEDKTFRIFNLQKNEQIYCLSVPNPVYGIASSPDNQYFSCCTQNQLYLYDYLNMECPTFITRLSNLQSRLTSVSFSLKYLITCGDKITLYNLEKLKKGQGFQEIATIHCDRCWDVKVIDDKYIVTNDGAIKIWELDYQKLIYCFKIPENQKIFYHFDVILLTQFSLKNSLMQVLI